MFKPAIALRSIAAVSGGLLALSALPAKAAVTGNPSIPNPTKVNLVFNRNASVDLSLTNFGNLQTVVQSPSTAKWAQANPVDATPDTYAIKLGQAWNVGTVEFLFAKYPDPNTPNSFFPLTYDIYASGFDDPNLFTNPANIIGNQSTAPVATPGSSDATPFYFAQIKQTTSASIAKFGIKVNSWTSPGGGADARGFLVGATANPITGSNLIFGGDIGVFNNSWNPGGVITSSTTGGGSISTTPFWDRDPDNNTGTNDERWTNNRWWSQVAQTDGQDTPVDVTIHLADYYRLTGLRWAAGQGNLPTDYQIFAANTVGAPTAGDWVPVTGALNFPGGNQGSLINFSTVFDGNWIQIRATQFTSDFWENTQWQVYGSVIPEPACLGIAAGGIMLLTGRRRRAV